MNTSASTFNRLLIDGHVHVHESYDEAQFIRSAQANLARNGEGFPALMLAEMAGVDFFAKWKDGKAPFSVTRTEEETSLLVEKALLVFAGRQIVTRERIEVLALLCQEHIPDGQAFGATLEQVQRAGALPVLPWGVGKWIGRRGKLIEEAVSNGRIFLGDNAGRPVGWRLPAFMRRHVVLPGTDPLRMASQQSVAGTYGFSLTGSFDLNRPSAALRRALLALEESPAGFGERVGVVGFLRQQIGLRLGK